MCKPLSFDLTAALSDLTSYTGRSSKRAKRVLNFLKGRIALEGKAILNLGCGPAPISEFFRQMSTLLVGLDREKRYLRQAQEKASLELVLVTQQAYHSETRVFSSSYEMTYWSMFSTKPN